MILAHAVYILLALAVCRSLFLRRNFMTPIGQRKLKGGWKIVAAIIFLYAVQSILVVYAPGQTTFQMLTAASTHIAVLFLLFANRHLPGVKLIFLGAALNFLVMAANGGWMPLTPENAHYVHPERPPAEIGVRPPSSKNIILDKEQSSLWILSDIIRITAPWRRSAISIGDVILVIGIGQFLFQVKAPPRARTRRVWIYDSQSASRNLCSSRPAPVFISPVAWQVH